MNIVHPWAPVTRRENREAGLLSSTRTTRWHARCGGHDEELEAVCDQPLDDWVRAGGGSLECESGLVPHESILALERPTAHRDVEGLSRSGLAELPGARRGRGIFGVPRRLCTDLPLPLQDPLDIAVLWAGAPSCMRVGSKRSVGGTWAPPNVCIEGWLRDAPLAGAPIRRRFRAERIRRAHRRHYQDCYQCGRKRTAHSQDPFHLLGHIPLTRYRAETTVHPHCSPVQRPR